MATLNTSGIEDAQFCTWSPDGKSVVFDGYQKNEGRRPFESDLGRARCGRSLYGMLAKDRLTHIVRIELPSSRTTIWRTIQSADPVGVVAHHCAHVTRDEKSYFCNETRLVSDRYVIDGLRT